MPKVWLLCTKGRVLFPVTAWILGIFLYFHQTLLSGFERIQGDAGDPRLINFILEHSYRWLRQIPPHCSFFDPPVFYPQTNVSSYTDLLLGVAPFYWVWRLTGFQPDTSYQLWMILLATLNFVAAYLLLKHFFSCGAIGSSIGAVVFAFGTLRYSSLPHQQLVPQFYVLIALMALLILFQEKQKVVPAPIPLRSNRFLFSGFDGPVLYSRLYLCLPGTRLRFRVGMGLAHSKLAQKTGEDCL